MKINSKKVMSALLVILLSLSLVLTATLAWQSINQEVTNVSRAEVNPGGRLHDDFNGSNKDVYVENFADIPIYARIQLREYLRIGADATPAVGTLVTTHGPGGVETVHENTSTWPIHYMSQPNVTDAYYEWEMGGFTKYMPTFNKNKDSREPDVNGTYEGTDGKIEAGEPYDDYVDYWNAANGEKEALAVSDADINDIDEYRAYIDEHNGMEPEQSDAEHYTVSREMHYVRETNSAIVMTMEEWLALPQEQQVGPYWVYDTDGWVYWAQPIAGVSADNSINPTTGLLLDKIIPLIDDDYYYAIHVVAQFVTANDVGSTDDSSGFYDVKNGTVPTTAAEHLLRKIGAFGTEFMILPSSTRVAPGSSVKFAAYNAEGVVTYRVDSAQSADTRFGDDVLHVGTDETMPRLTVTAESDSGIIARYTIAVSDDAPTTEPVDPPAADDDQAAAPEQQTGSWAVKVDGQPVAVEYNRISVRLNSAVRLNYANYDGTLDYELEGAEKTKLVMYNGGTSYGLSLMEQDTGKTMYLHVKSDGVLVDTLEIYLISEQEQTLALPTDLPNTISTETEPEEVRKGTWVVTDSQGITKAVVDNQLTVTLPTALNVYYNEFAGEFEWIRGDTNSNVIETVTAQMMTLSIPPDVAEDIIVQVKSNGEIVDTLTIHLAVQTEGTQQQTLNTPDGQGESDTGSSLEP